MRWLGLALRRLRDDRWSAAGLGLLVLVTALAASLTPRVLARLSDDAVRAEVNSAPAVARSIQLIEEQTLGPGSDADPLRDVVAAGVALDTTVPASIRRLVATSDVIVQTSRFKISRPTTDPSFVRFRIQQGVASHLAWVAGRPPTPTVTTRDDVGPELVSGVPVYEAGISTRTAKAFGAAVGDTLPLTGDPSDPLLGRGGRPLYAFALVTGIYELTDPGSDYWLGDELLDHPVIRSVAQDVLFLDADLLLADGTNARLAVETESFGHVLRYTWRRLVDTSRIDARDVPLLVVDARRLTVAYPSANVTRQGDTALRTGLLPLLLGFETRWTAAESIIAVTAVGPGVLALATLALVAALGARRRRATLGVARSRGASGAQVLVAAALEGVALGLPAAAMAVVAAILAVPGAEQPASVGAGVAVMAAAIAVVLWTAAPVARAQGTEPRAGARVVTRGGARRVVLEALVVVGAGGAAWLLRERGVRPTGATGEAAGFDPLLAAVPVLAGIAAGLIALRIYPWPLRLAAAIGRRGRGLVTMLAARRATDGGTAAIVLLVLLATATVGAFAGATLDGLDRGAEAAAWQAVGGGYRLVVPNTPIPDDLDAATLPGVEAAAGEFQATFPIGLNGPRALFDAVEAGALERVLAGSPAAPAFPDGFTTPGTGPIPAIVSTSLVGIPRGVNLGDTFTVSVEGFNLQYRAVAARTSFPGIASGLDFVVVPREWFKAQAPEARISPVEVVVRAPAGAAAVLREAAAKREPAVVVTSQAEDAAARRGSPVTGAVRSVIVAATLLAILYAVLAAAAGLALAGVARGEETAQLRTLGLTARQGYALAVAEHGPAAMAALVAGAVLGTGLYVLLRQGLGIPALVGSDIDVPVAVDPGLVLLLLAAMAGVVGVGLALGAFLGRRVAPMAVIRGRYE